MKGNMNRMFWIALAATIPMLGCALDDSDANDPATSDETQASTGFEPKCQVRHPIGWTVGGNACREFGNAYSLLNPGEQHTYHSGSGPNYGYVTLQCDANGDGFFFVVDKVCYNGREP